MKFTIKGGKELKLAFIKENAQYIRNAKAYEESNENFNKYPMGFETDETNKTIYCYFNGSPIKITDIIYHLPDQWKEACEYLQTMYNHLHKEAEPITKGKPISEFNYLVSNFGKWMFFETISGAYGVFKNNEDGINADENYCRYSEFYNIVYNEVHDQVEHQCNKDNKLQIKYTAFRLATKEDMTRVFTLIAENKGYKQDKDIIIKPLDDNNSVIKSNTTTGLCALGYLFIEYDLDTNKFYYNAVCVYKEGQWAEILPEAQPKIYKAGQWLFVSDDNVSIGVFKLKEDTCVNSEKFNYTEFYLDFYNVNKVFEYRHDFITDLDSIKNIRLATEKDMVKIFTIVATELKGYKEGVTIKSQSNNCNVTFNENIIESYFGCNYHYFYYLGICVYINGKWAEIVESNKLTFPTINYPNRNTNININGYIAIFYEDYVEFGCAQIGKSYFDKAYELMFVYDCKGNRNVEAISIGKGNFSRKQIKEIYEYYQKIENKKNVDEDYKNKLILNIKEYPYSSFSVEGSDILLKTFVEIFKDSIENLSSYDLTHYDKYLVFYINKNNVYSIVYSAKNENNFNLGSQWDAAVYYGKKLLEKYKNNN